MKQIKEVGGLGALSVIISLFLLIPVAYGEETSNDIDVRVDSVRFHFIRTFSAESPVYSFDPTHGWRSFSSFRFNETYRSKMVDHYIKLNQSGNITFKDDPRGYIHFVYRDRPETSILINSHYVRVFKRFDDSNLTMGEFKKIYEDMRDFVLNNISTNRGFCFESPPDAEYNRFCPFIKQSGKYQRARWTILIEF